MSLDPKPDPTPSMASSVTNDEKRDSTAGTVFQADAEAQDIVQKDRDDFSQIAAESATRETDWHTSKLENADGHDEVAHNEAKLHTWHGNDDPEHPHNWALSRKLRVTVMLALVTFSISINSAMFGPVVPYVAEEMNVSNEVAILGTSLYLLVSSIHQVMTKKALDSI